MVELRRYGPVLDTTVEVIKHLTRHGEAELRVPVHPEATGMAVDVQHFLFTLYPYIDCVLLYIQRAAYIFAWKKDGWS